MYVSSSSFFLYILIDMSLTHGLIYNVCIFASFFKVTNGT